MQCYKPRGRIYRCPACGFIGHRDGVGWPISSPAHTGEPGHVWPTRKYRHPFAGKRSRPDTAEMAWGPSTAKATPSQEAAPF